jgi:hypothetical protein
MEVKENTDSLFTKTFRGSWTFICCFMPKTGGRSYQKIFKQIDGNVNNLTQINDALTWYGPRGNDFYKDRPSGYLDVDDTTKWVTAGVVYNATVDSLWIYLDGQKMWRNGTQGYGSYCTYCDSAMVTGDNSNQLVAPSDGYRRIKDFILADTCFSEANMKSLDSLLRLVY